LPDGERPGAQPFVIEECLRLLSTAHNLILRRLAPDCHPNLNTMDVHTA
jgi:hypothetical protein